MTYFDIERSDAVRFVPADCRNVLDVGCGSGATIRLLRRSIPAANFIGIEINEAVAAEVDAPVVVGDIQRAETRARFENYRGTFDCIMALDVLEHLIDPWECVQYLSSLLVPGGTMVISLPNVSNLKVIAPLLLANRFQYQDAGILDRTHLRFFTRDEAQRLVMQAGLQVIAIAPTGPLKWKDVCSKAGVAVYFLNRLSLGLFERFFAHQYIICARLVNG